MVRYAPVPVPTYEKLYRVGTNGSLWRRRRKGDKGRTDGVWSVDGKWRKLATRPDADGYATAILCDKGRRTAIKVHHLVLEAFVGPRPAGKECRHLNGVPDCNYRWNLKWGTPKKNKSDQIRHGTIAVKLSMQAIIKARKIRKQKGISYAKIVQKLKLPVTEETLRRAVIGESWTR